jgi:hypothetical protein
MKPFKIVQLWKIQYWDLKNLHLAHKDEMENKLKSSQKSYLKDQ